MSAQQRLVDRLVTIYGEPKTDDPVAYINEFEKAVKGFAAEVLQAAGDEVIRECKYWPRPAEVVDRANAICLKIEAGKPKPPPEPDMPPPTPEQIARAREITRLALVAMRKQDAERLPELPPVDRPAFERMQRQSPNWWLHRKAPGLSETSRRMTGEHQE